MSKKKFTPIPVHSQEGLESSVAQTVQLKLQVAARQAHLESKIAQLQKMFADEILPLEREIEAREAGIYVYASSARDQLFPGGKKSIDTLVARIGFRTSPPSVERLNPKDKWSTIAARLASLPWGEIYVRTPDPEVDKDALIKARGELPNKLLATAGISIVSNETFFIEPHAELAPASISAPTPAL